jgi:hydroxymethylglutaryl-CoA synthase
MAASIFSATIRGSTSAMSKSLNVKSRLDSRTKIHPERYDEIMSLREKTHNARNYNPQSKVEDDNLFLKTFYLEKVDDKFRRTYVVYDQ